MHKAPLVLLFLAMLAPAAGGQREITTRPASQPNRLEYRVTPLVDLYNYVREQTTRREKADAPPEFNAAIAAARDLRHKLGTNVLVWAGIDEKLVRDKTAADLKRQCE